jgi:hypothetical protein
MRARRGSWASLGGLSTSKCRIVALFENHSSRRQAGWYSLGWTKVQ